MVIHYIRVALRNLERQKTLAFINILGLSVGLACFTLFLLYAVNEFSYDRFHTNGPNIYRVYNWWAFDGKEKESEPASATPLGPAMKNDLPEVENFVRIQGESQKLIRIEDKIHRINVTFADPQIFSVFTFPLISGEATSALKNPHNIVLTKATALQLFGEPNVIGREVEMKIGEEYETFIVGAVSDEIPVNSTIDFDILGSFDYILNSEIGKASLNNWNMTIGIAVYVQLRAGSNLMYDAERLASFRQKYFPEEGIALQKEGLWNGKGLYPNGFGLQPLTDVHMNIKIDPWGSVDSKNIIILVGIAAGVLLIACINFIILAIGRSAGRSKEVGVRKIIGSQRKQLAFQFLAESFLLTFFSAVLGLGIAQTLLPLFNELSGRSLEFSFAAYPEMIALIMGTIIFAGFLAGSYPALVLSGLKPVEVLRNKVRISGSNLFTKSLVTFQFVVSVTLIIATIIILQQLSFMRSKDLGFEKENVVMISSQGVDTEKIYPLLKQKLLSHPVVADVAASAIGLGAGEGQMGRAYDFKEKKEGVIEYPVDVNFLSVLEIQLVAGRNFDPDIASDTVTSIIVNESLVRNGLNTTPEKALGMSLKNSRGDQAPKNIIGVVKDFHYEDLTRFVRPQLFFQPAFFKPSCFFVRIKSGDPAHAIAILQTTWKSIVPELPFQFSFLDQKFDDFYKAEERWSNILGLAGNICIFLAGLGLFGLASLAIVNRTKEIGIRKVLGASVVSVVSLLCRDFIKLVIIAIVIASPIAWYTMNQWLRDFAYKIELKWWMFAVTGLLAIALALLTVSIQAINAALINPVKSLKSE